MTLDMWFKDDIANNLQGIVCTAASAGSSQPPEWQHGFAAALQAVAVSFGITLRQPERPARDPQLYRVSRVANGTAYMERTP